MKYIEILKLRCITVFIMFLGSVSVLSQDYVALNTNSRVRTSPTVKSDAVEGQWGYLVLSKGEVHRVIGESGDWYHIVISGFNNTKGYVMKKFCISACGKLPDNLPAAEGEQTVSVTKGNDGIFWLKYQYDDSRTPVKGVWHNGILLFPYTMKQMFGADYGGDNYMDVAASYVVIDGKVYAKEYTRTD